MRWVLSREGILILPSLLASGRASEFRREALSRTLLLKWLARLQLPQFFSSLPQRRFRRIDRQNAGRKKGGKNPGAGLNTMGYALLDMNQGWHFEVAYIWCATTR